MNERIKELAEQSIAEYWHQPYNDRQRILENFSDFMEIFAKSIIQECAGICMIEYDTGLEPAPQAPQIARQIKQHFGVE